MSSGNTFKDVLKAAERALKYLTSQGGYKAEDISRPEYQKLIDETYKVFDSAIRDNDIPEEMMRALQSDAFLFGSLKTHAQLLEADSLLTKDGRVKSYRELDDEFRKLNVEYNQNYLEAEYQFAVNSSQMAAKWAELDEDGRYNLQYRTASDDRVRPEHAELEGITLPKDDAFWLEYYPPNGWNCRCTVVEVRKSKFPESDPEEALQKGEAATTQIGKDGKNRAEIFRFNPGKEEKLFPPAHPYNKLKGVKTIIDNLDVGRMIQSLPEWSSLKKYDNGGEIRKHSLVDPKDSDYKVVRKSADWFAKSGEKVDLLPRYDATLKNPEYAKLYADLKDTKYWGKCPDMRINGLYYENEGHQGSGDYSKMLRRGVKQSDNIILQYTGQSDSYLKKLIKFRINEGQEINEVWIDNNGELTQFFKNPTPK